jgi:hypothetical protein
VTDPDPAATIRSLRAEFQRAQEDAENLRERLSYAEQLILNSGRRSSRGSIRLRHREAPNP